MAGGAPDSSPAWTAFGFSGICAARTSPGAWPCCSVRSAPWCIILESARYQPLLAQCSASSPYHLYTREAAAGYLDKLAPDGLFAANFDRVGDGGRDNYLPHADRADPADPRTCLHTGWAPRFEGVVLEWERWDLTDDRPFFGWWCLGSEGRALLAAALGTLATGALFFLVFLAFGRDPFLGVAVLAYLLAASMAWPCGVAAS